MNKTDLDEFYATLLEYRDILDHKISKGKIDPYSAKLLAKKLNQWYENHPSYSERFDVLKYIDELLEEEETCDACDESEEDCMCEHCEFCYGNLELVADCSCDYCDDCGENIDADECDC